jgi:hypothetical protein
MQWTAQEMGRKGGKISKRTLTAKQARAMVRAREAKRSAGIGVVLKSLEASLQKRRSVIDREIDREFERVTGRIIE